MHPRKVDRTHLQHLTDLPNIGKAGAADLRLLGIHEPQQLIGMCAFVLYERLCKKMGTRLDPCVLDVFIAVTRFMDGAAPQPWWAFTAERKQLLSQRTAK